MCVYLHAEGVHQVRCDAHLILRQLDVLDSDLTHQLLRLSQGEENEREIYDRLYGGQHYN